MILLLIHVPSQLSVFNGDQVTGENLSPSNASSYLSLVFSAAVSHSTPFTSVYGNHDNAPSISHSLLYAYEKEHFGTLSLTQSTPTSAEDQNGRFNYFLEVWGEEVGFGVPEVILWFFDSRSGIFDDPSDYEDWVDPSVVSVSFSSSPCLLQLLYNSPACYASVDQFNLAFPPGEIWCPSPFARLRPHRTLRRQSDPIPDRLAQSSVPRAQR